jgi:hypothetical protein
MLTGALHIGAPFVLGTLVVPHVLPPLLDVWGRSSREPQFERGKQVRDGAIAANY